MCSFLGIENTFPYEVEKRYPVIANSYYLSLIDRNDPEDPVLRQVFPDQRELQDESSSYDPLAENMQMPVPRLIHRFDDRAVLLTTSRCAVHCRAEEAAQFVYTIGAFQELGPHRTRDGRDTHAHIGCYGFHLQGGLSVRAVQEEIAARRTAAMVGNTYRVLVEDETREKDGLLTGRTLGNVNIDFAGDSALVGTFCDVRVTSAGNWVVHGELVK